MWRRHINFFCCLFMSEVFAGITLFSCIVCQVKFVCESRKFLLASQDGQGQDIDDLVNCILETLITVFPAISRYTCHNIHTLVVCSNFGCKLTAVFLSSFQWLIAQRTKVLCPLFDENEILIAKAFSLVWAKCEILICYRKWKAVYQTWVDVQRH